MTFHLPPSVTGSEKRGLACSSIEPAAGVRQAVLDAGVWCWSLSAHSLYSVIGSAGLGRGDGQSDLPFTDLHFRTNVAAIYASAIGREGVMLAHKAEDEAVACAEIIAGRRGM